MLLQLDAMEQRGEEKMVNKYLQVTRFMNAFFLEEVTLR